MAGLGVPLLFSSFPDAVHWQEKRSVRKIPHCAPAFDAGRTEVATGVPSRAESTKGKDNGDESFQTLVTQDPVARDNRGCDAAAGLGAILQGAGGESGAFHGKGRRRTLPSPEGD